MLPCNGRETCLCWPSMETASAAQVHSGNVCKHTMRSITQHCSQSSLRGEAFQRSTANGMLCINVRV